MRAVATVVTVGLLAGCGGAPARDRATTDSSVLAALRDRTDAPVVVPANLPSGTRVRSVAAEPGHAR